MRKRELQMKLAELLEGTSSAFTVPTQETEGVNPEAATSVATGNVSSPAPPREETEVERLRKVIAEATRKLQVAEAEQAGKYDSPPPRDGGSLLDSLETEFGQVSSQDDEVQNISMEKGQTEAAIAVVKQGKTMTFLRTKEGLKWVAEAHDKINAVEDATIPQQMVRKLCNWDLGIVNDAWFLDEGVQEEYNDMIC